MHLDENVESEIDRARSQLDGLGSAELEALKRRDRAALEAAWAEHDVVLANLRSLEQHRRIAEAAEPLADESVLAAISQRWRDYGPWCAPPRNVLWVETRDGQPIAAVTCTSQGLAQGELQRRREALAHAPEDIQFLLRTIEKLEQRCISLSVALVDRLGHAYESDASPSPLRVVA